MDYILKDYDNALETVLSKGIRRPNRTGVDTLSLFGVQTRYDISERVPLLTKRKVFPKSVIGELLWMLHGETNIKQLEGRGSKIWSAWRNEDFEIRNGYEEGELGPIYGWQMRNTGGNFPDRTTGFDQVKYVINELKNNKESRRIMIDLWEPEVVLSDKVRLPPCHFCYLFYVEGENLSCMQIQRSVDAPIGLPANLFFCSVLVHMLAKECGLKPKEVVHSGGDFHIYVNQIEAIEEYLGRSEGISPRLEMVGEKSFFDWEIGDFKVIGYEPLGVIKIPVEV